MKTVHEVLSKNPEYDPLKPVKYRWKCAWCKSEHETDGIAAVPVPLNRMLCADCDAKRLSRLISLFKLSPVDDAAARKIGAMKSPEKLKLKLAHLEQLASSNSVPDHLRASAMLVLARRVAAGEEPAQPPAQSTAEKLWE